MRAFVVRHGNTFSTGEPPRRIGSRTDIPLVDEGRAQADRLHTFFAEHGITFRRAISGRLSRARETAQRVLSGAALSIETAWWLDEIDHGPDEGLTEAMVEARIGRAALVRWDRDAVAPPGWAVDVEWRIAAWRHFFANAEAGATLLVTSNGAARFALHSCEGRAVLPSMKLATGAFGLIERDLNGGLNVVQWNVRP